MLLALFELGSLFIFYLESNLGCKIWLHSTKSEFFFLNTSCITHAYNTSRPHTSNEYSPSNYFYWTNCILISRALSSPNRTLGTSLWGLSQSQSTSYSGKSVPSNVTGHYQSKRSLLLDKNIFFLLLPPLPLFFPWKKVYKLTISIQNKNNIKLQ